MRRVVLLLLAAALPSLAADQWLRITTPDFELYTSAGEKKGRAVILHFERVREFFLKASPVRNLSDVPVRLIEFGSDEEYRRYAVTSAAVAYYLPGAARDFIVMDEEKMRDLGTATHEYTHLIVRHSGLRLPVWLNEGWAEVYSSLRPLKNEAAIGDLIPGRMAELNREKWLDFETLTSVTQSSPIYRESDRIGIFYAESWALAHMLYLAPEYAEGFGKFVTALNQGRNSDEACRLTWGKSGAQVFEDLRKYFDRKKLVGRIYETRLDKAQAEPVVVPLGDFDASLGLAELLAAAGKVQEAKQAFDRLEAEQPGNPAVARSLGFLAVQNKDLAGALRYFEQAFERGETDARMCFALAMMERDARQKPDLIVAALERAVKSRPGYTEAEMNLGLMKIARRDYPGGIAALMGIDKVTPEQAPLVFCNLAYARVETGELEAARSDLGTCRKWAKTSAEVSRATELGRMIDARSKPAAGVQAGEKTRRVTGTARSLECTSGDGGPARLHIVNGPSELMFDVPEAAAVEVIRTQAGDAGFAMRCGPLKPIPLTVEFAAPLGPTASVGIARRVEF
jgi:tetratricopeptide (TPR) repeat protein